MQAKLEELQQALRDFDKSLLEQEFVFGGTGSPEHDLKNKPRNLILLTGATLVQIV